MSELKEHTAAICAAIEAADLEKKVELINAVRSEIHQVSPFKAEPVDCVLWARFDQITANDYNPNTVAPPEMELLFTSIKQDGYTQPIVSWEKDRGKYEVVDGFHRHRVGKEKKEVSTRIQGYLPISVINEGCSGRNHRMASTIRHNRARGKHQVQAMSDIVVELKNRNWTNVRIARELGMEQDEVLRLCQITGLKELFADREFSKSWVGDIGESELEELTDDVTTYEEEIDDFRTVNTNDENRVFHTFDKWECHKCGFYKTTHDKKSKDECLNEYAEVLKDSKRFESALKRVIQEWPNSCEHYLTNTAMNRLAWLGQAAVCIDTGIPSTFSAGWELLTKAQQEKANKIALRYLNKWLSATGRDKASLEQAKPERQMELY